MASLDALIQLQGRSKPSHRPYCFVKQNLKRNNQEDHGYPSYWDPVIFSFIVLLFFLFYFVILFYFFFFFLNSHWWMDHCVLCNFLCSMPGFSYSSSLICPVTGFYSYSCVYLCCLASIKTVVLWLSCPIWRVLKILETYIKQTRHLPGKKFYLKI